MSHPTCDVKRRVSRGAYCAKKETTRASDVPKSSDDPILPGAAPSAGRQLSDVIREARKLRGLSKTELGVKLGIQKERAYRRVHAWETNETQPSRENVFALARELDLKLEDWAGALQGTEPTNDEWSRFKGQAGALTDEEVRFLRTLWLPDDAKPGPGWYDALLGLFRMLPRR